MKTETVIEKNTLDAETIGEFSEKTGSYLLSAGVSRREAVRHALTVEEILIKSKDIGEEAGISFGKRLGRPFFELKIKGEPKNVFRDEANDGVLNESILKNLGLSPVYSYENGRNEYRFKTKKKKLNPLIMLLITIAAAIAVGFAGMLIPEGIRTEILESVLLPVHSAFLGALGTVAGPMIFVSVAWGIYGIGDAATLKTVGKGVLGGYIGTTFLGAFAAMAAIPFFDLHFDGGTAGSLDFKSIFSLLLSMIPSNFVNAFAQGNTMQIIVIAAVMGIAMLFLDKKTTAVARAVEQLQSIIQLAIEWILTLVPYFIGINIVSMIWKGGIFAASGIGKTVFLMIAFDIALAAVLLLMTALVNKTSPVKLIKSILPILVVGLSTSSSPACYPLMDKCSNDDLGVDKSVTSFGVPLGMVVLRGFCAMKLSIIMYFLAEYYQLNISVPWFVMVGITTSILTMSMVPVPGGALAIYVMLLSQLGLPAEGLALLLILNPIFDLLSTGFDRAMLPLVLCNSAHRLGMVKKPHQEASSR